MPAADEAGRPQQIWTVGHSTHTVAELIALLEPSGIELLADIRSVPRSRHNPQFNQENLPQPLEQAGIAYLHLKELGGWRQPRPDSINAGWKNDTFRGYADYLQTEEFAQALARLIELARERRTVLLCAEALPWRCHRHLLSDALVVAGLEVLHIFAEGKIEAHRLNPLAVVSDGRLSYPPLNPRLDGFN